MEFFAERGLCVGKDDIAGEILKGGGDRVVALI